MVLGAAALVASSLELGAAGTGAVSAPASEDNWPGWRGPAGDGVAPDTELPLRWSDSENVLWKRAIEGRGLSSPIVWDGRIFVTTAIEHEPVEGAGAPVHLRHGWADRDPAQREPYLHPDSVGSDRRHEMRLLSLDASSGDVIWERTAYDGTVFDDRHRAASYASATPVTDGVRVFAWFGSQGLFAYDFDGELVWSFAPGGLPTWGLGHGTSPVLFDGLVILMCDRDNGDDSFIVALDATTGEEVWRHDRTVRANWSTPLLVESDGQAQLVTNGFQYTAAYDPRTGAELWRGPGLTGNVIASPVADGDRVYLSVGYPNRITHAVSLTTRGGFDETGLDWTYGKGTAYVASNLLLGEFLYLLADNGMLTCLRATTGEVVYEGGRVPVASRFSASPVGWGDHILLSGQDGDMFVVQAGPEHVVLATNSMGEPLWASPAIAGGRLYVRGERHLFAIGNEDGLAARRVTVPE